MCCSSTHVVAPWSDSATVSDLCLFDSLVLKLASPFLILMLASPCLALYLLLADYFTAIATALVLLSGRCSSKSITPASSDA